MRIAILVCSVDSSDFSHQYPNDGEKFVTLLGPLRPEWSFHPVAANEGVLPERADEYDGYIVTGSPKSNRAAAAWVKRLHAFIMALDEARRPTVGICFGHQAIAEALGGRLQENPGESEAERFHAGVARLHLCAALPWMDPPADTLDLYTAHGEQVTNLPPTARLVGWNHRCPVAAFTVGEHMLGCEFHPELYRDFIRAMIVSRADDLDEAFVEARLAEIEGETQGPLFGRWIVNFLEGVRT